MIFLFLQGGGTAPPKATAAAAASLRDAGFAGPCGKKTVNRHVAMKWSTSARVDFYLS